MPNTTNFNWNTPADTDLVKDGAAAIRTLGNNIDASLVDLKGGTTGQVLAKATNADLDFTWTNGGDITEVIAGTGLTGGGTSGAVTVSLSTPVSATNGGTAQTTYATGDLLFASATNTLSKRAIGSTGQVLTVSGGVPTWGAAPAAAANWSLLNTGGTTLSGATTTVSGISGAEQILVMLIASSSSASSLISLRLNSDSGSNYSQRGVAYNWGSTYAAGNGSTMSATANTEIRLGKMSATASSLVTAYCLINGANSSGLKVYQQIGAGTASGNSGADHYLTGGFYTGTSTISSISIISDTGNFDDGTVWVYTSAA